MSELKELERRITSALDRIGNGIEELGAAAPEPDAAPPDDEELERLRDALATEQEAKAELEERVKELQLRQDTEIKALSHELAETKASLEAAEAQDDAASLRVQLRESQALVQKVRRNNHQLRETVERLRETADGDGPDADLINRAMIAELESLRTAREVDRAEMDAILAELKPLLQEEADA